MAKAKKEFHFKKNDFWKINIQTIIYILAHELLLLLFAQKPKLFRHIKSNVDCEVGI